MFVVGLDISEHLFVQHPVQTHEPQLEVLRHKRVVLLLGKRVHSHRIEVESQKVHQVALGLVFLFYRVLEEFVVEDVGPEAGVIDASDLLTVDHLVLPHDFGLENSLVFSVKLFFVVIVFQLLIVDLILLDSQRSQLFSETFL